LGGIISRSRSHYQTGSFGQAAGADVSAQVYQLFTLSQDCLLFGAGESPVPLGPRCVNDGPHRRDVSGSGWIRPRSKRHANKIRDSATPWQGMKSVPEEPSTTPLHAAPFTKPVNGFFAALAKKFPNDFPTFGILYVQQN